MSSLTPLPEVGPGRVAVEICVDDVDGVLAAEAEGADRVELCAALSEGGVTPSLGLVQTVLARIARIDVQVMIRPRGGDFTFSASELSVMLADIEALRSLPRSPQVSLGFVLGALTPDRDIDRPMLARLKAACGTAPTTFHKAFDLTPDLPKALAVLASLGIDRVLTSGGAETAERGSAMLARLVREGPPGVTILAAGGIRAHNVEALLGRTGVREVHLRAMQQQNGRPPVTSGADIAAVLRAAGAMR